jgi:hypothetical protein
VLLADPHAEHEDLEEDDDSAGSAGPVELRVEEREGDLPQRHGGDAEAGGGQLHPDSKAAEASGCSDSEQHEDEEAAGHQQAERDADEVRPLHQVAGLRADCSERESKEDNGERTARAELRAGEVQAELLLLAPVKEGQRVGRLGQLFAGGGRQSSRNGCWV